MTSRLFSGPFYRFVCVLLAVLMAVAPSASVFAQTNAAQQAVRGRVEQFGPYSPGPANPYESVPNDPSVPKIDTNFIAPSAAAVLVIRPAQILTSPAAEMLPKEVATAAGTTYLGFDPAEVEEIVAFVDMSNPLAPSYGITVKFINPFRAAVIPVERRAHAQLAELGGKKYLQSALPAPLYSLYGPNSKTLVVAPDTTLRQLVDSIGQPKTGPIMDRLQAAPAGSDLYLAVDVAALRPLLQMGTAQAQAHLPPDAKPFLEMPNLITAAEATFNLSNDGPISFVLHANDEAAAQQLETMMLEAKTKYQAGQGEAGYDPLQQALAQYTQRVSQPFTPQRNGASLTCFYVDGQNAAQKQMIAGIVNALFAFGVPAAMQAASRAAEPSEGTTEPATEFDIPPVGESDISNER